jgi:TMEM175 potassium channel family protein
MEESNPNSRLEAFCDGVFAIAITLLVLDIKVPSSEQIHTTNNLWLSLKQLFPSIFAFLLSFTIVFISWFNHHATLKLINKSSSTFIYANGFLLLTVVIIPFPTALLSEYLLTDHAAPAVVVYSAVNGLEAFAWILLSRAALKPVHLTRNEKSTLVLRENQRNAYIGLAIYIVCTAIAFWYPLAIAILISAIYIGWLIIGLNIRSE